MGAPSPGFRRLAFWTGVATFFLIVLGGIVRVSDSGLGCGPAGSGFSGWPLCEGDVLPGLDLNAVVEYSHRTLAGIVGLMMFALAVLAFRRYRGSIGIVRASIAAAALVVLQGLLGAVVVEENLDEALVATHLLLAMLLLALVIYIWRSSRPDVIGAEPPDGGPRFKGLALSSAGLVLGTIVAGGYMAGTQNYGRADYQLGDGAHHACGREFPTCNDAFLPFGESRLVDIHLTHRVFVYLATIAVIWLVVTALRRRPNARVVTLAHAAGGILLVQLVLGALNVWLEEYEVLIVAHLAVGTLLWAALVGLILNLYKVPSPVGASPPVERDSVTA
ncbi:MAG: COX15/CtaA family protein [Thermoleophilaceae bacterium]|nr:COX15/CtaA family protein [Thermoleophilaceae bacterium]